MAKRSAGLLMYRLVEKEPQVFLVHPGGPFWKNKDDGAWMIPKGEIAAGEDELAAAKREFREETGLEPRGHLILLGSVKHKSGKIVTAWAFEGDCDPAAIRSNTFTMEWPPRSGRQQEFPEVDRAAFWSLSQARTKILAVEAPFLETLSRALTERA